MNVLITGAAGGLGRAFAVECARRGWRLFLTDINAAGLESLREGLSRGYGAQIDSFACDITNSAALDALFARAQTLGFCANMLLNIAGGDAEGAFLTRDAASIERLVRLNVCAALDATHKALTARNEHIPFHVVFTSSMASLYPMPFKAAYAASKRFLLDFSLALRRELRLENVTVTTLCPAGLATTGQALSGIAAQGFLGSATANDLTRVARKTLDKALRDRFLYIPGILNKALFLASKLVPREAAAYLIYRRWGKARGEA